MLDVKEPCKSDAACSDTMVSLLAVYCLILTIFSFTMCGCEGLSLQLLNSSDDTCIHLLCSLEGLNPELVNFTWSRGCQRSLHPSTSYDMKSELHLCKPDWSDGDKITCHASYSSVQTPLSRNITLDFSNEGE
ncbi:hypothetical protein DPX16_0629 [Anabarilius grahami]|uniref:Ig-like domain-containing protein n=1 Tax=Anabarilius grahami TaxID=495550 RepID=A0A3N0YJU6_ANAGA|nr:hypothetical protein DPX16_0629 [Anabarilius grahami]